MRRHSSWNWINHWHGNFRAKKQPDQTRLSLTLWKENVITLTLMMTWEYIIMQFILYVWINQPPCHVKIIFINSICFHNLLFMTLSWQISFSLSIHALPCWSSSWRTGLLHPEIWVSSLNNLFNFKSWSGAYFEQDWKLYLVQIIVKKPSIWILLFVSSFSSSLPVDSFTWPFQIKRNNACMYQKSQETGNCEIFHYFSY